MAILPWYWVCLLNLKSKVYQNVLCFVTVFWVTESRVTPCRVCVRGLRCAWPRKGKILSHPQYSLPSLTHVAAIHGFSSGGAGVVPQCVGQDANCHSTIFVTGFLWIVRHFDLQTTKQVLTMSQGFLFLTCMCHSRQVRKMVTGLKWQGHSFLSLRF